MKNKNTTIYDHNYNEFFGFGQQSFKFNLMDYKIPENDPVFTLKKVMEELDFTKLLSAYSSVGRRPYNPIMMFALLLYGNMRRKMSIDDIVYACQMDLGFIYLAQGQTPKRDAFYNFKNNKVSQETLDDLHYQFMRKLKEKGLITLEVLYVDGTKIEANANRYTFVWRGTLNAHLIKLLDDIQSLYERYNEFIVENEYDVTYGILPETMFIVEGADKVKKVVLENKKRKRVNKKKLPHNIHLEIDNIGPQSIVKIKAILEKLAHKEAIEFKYGKGQRKSELQRIYEAFHKYGSRLEKYKENFEVMGDDRNSFSKTDIDATFMRMKDDHMMNGQLKPGYNLQHGIENEFITDIYISNDRTDYATLIPLLTKHELMTGVQLKEVTADSGYCSEENLRFCIENGIDPYIKLQEHERKKTRKYHQDIGKHYNMERLEKLDEDGNVYYEYKCHYGRLLKLTHKSTSHKRGFKQEFEHYECTSCEGCPLKKDCFYNYNEEKYKDRNKTMTINQKWEELKAVSDKNIHSERGILNRQIRSIQAEGSFGDMKHNDDFARFNTRGHEKVYKETMFYVFGRNIIKYHRFKTEELKPYEGKLIQ